MRGFFPDRNGNPPQNKMDEEYKEGDREDFPFPPTQPTQSTQPGTQRPDGRPFDDAGQVAKLMD